MTLSRFFLGENYPPKKTRKLRCCTKGGESNFYSNQSTWTTNPPPTKLAPFSFPTKTNSPIFGVGSFFFCQKKWPLFFELIGFPFQGAMWSIRIPNSSKVAGCHCANVAYWGHKQLGGECRRINLETWIESNWGSRWNQVRGKRSFGVKTQSRRIIRIFFTKKHIYFLEKQAGSNFASLNFWSLYLRVVGQPVGWGQRSFRRWWWLR